MKPLQDKLLAALYRADVGSGRWRAMAWSMLDEFIRRNGDLEPVPFRKAWRSIGHTWDGGYPAKCVSVLKKQLMDEATGLTAIRRRKREEAEITLFTKEARA